MSTDLVDTLARVPLLAGVSRKDLKKLAGVLTERTVPAGGMLTEEGTAGVGFFIVLEGQASVDVSTQPKLGPGDWFGEIAVLSADRVRTATIWAETDVRCAGLTPWDLRAFLAKHPDVAWTMLQVLADRFSHRGD